MAAARAVAAATALLAAAAAVRGQIVGSCSASDRVDCQNAGTEAACSAAGACTWDPSALSGNGWCDPTHAATCAALTVEADCTNQGAPSNYCTWTDCSTEGFKCCTVSGLSPIGNGTLDPACENGDTLSALHFGGAACNHTCDEGYALRGGSVLSYCGGVGSRPYGNSPVFFPGDATCVPDAPPEPEPEPAGCVVEGLSAPTNGGLGVSCGAGDELSSGDSCALTCDAGYRVSGAQPSCTDGVLSVGSVVCLENLCSRVVFGAGVAAGYADDGCVDGGALTAHTNSSCSVRCAAGFFQSGGTATVACGSSAAHGAAPTGGLECSPLPKCAMPLDPKWSSGYSVNAPPALGELVSANELDLQCAAGLEGRPAAICSEDSSAVDSVDVTSITGLTAARAGNHKWHSAVLSSDGTVYGLPWRSTSVLRIVPATDTATDTWTLDTLIGLSKGGGSVWAAGDGTVDKWIGGALAPNGKIYGIPYQTEQVLIIDTADNSIDTSSITGLTGGAKWMRGALAPNGMIYAAPYFKDFILIVDPMTDSADTTSLRRVTHPGLGNGASGQNTNNKWSDAQLAPNGLIYCTPYNAPSVLIIDPSAGSAAGAVDTSTISGLSTDTAKWAGSVLGPDGKIYSMPYYADEILVIDPSNNTATTFAVTCNENGGNCMASWNGGVLAPNGKIYGIPKDSNDVLIISPSANNVTVDLSTISGLDGSLNKFTGGVLAQNGNIYAMPAQRTYVMIILPAVSSFTFDGCSDFPSVSIAIESALSPHRLDPSRRLALTGVVLDAPQVPTPIGGATLQWSLTQIRQADGTNVTDDVAMPGLDARALNFVVPAGTLEAGGRYRVTLSATTGVGTVPVGGCSCDASSALPNCANPDSDPSGPWCFTDGMCGSLNNDNKLGEPLSRRFEYCKGVSVVAQEIFTMNDAPRGGTFSVTPDTGVSMETDFTAAASGWSDEDGPLTYALHCSQGSHTAKLTDPGPAASTSLQLPAGLASNEGGDYRMRLTIRVADTYGTYTEASANVTATPYEPAPGVSWSEDTISKLQAAQGDGIAVAAMNIAATLNTLSVSESALRTDVRAARLEVARSLLTAARSRMASTKFDGDAMSDFYSATEQLTRQVESVSVDTVDTVLDILDAAIPSASCPADDPCRATGELRLCRLSTAPQATFCVPATSACGCALSSTAAEVLSSTAANLVLGSQGAANTTVAEAAQRVASVTTLLTTISKTLALGLADGENAVQISTAAFALEVQRQSSQAMLIGGSIGSGRVTVPSGLPLGQHKSVATEVVAWDNNPFRSTRDSAGEVTAGVVTVNMHTADGQTLSVSDLDRPFLVTLPAALDRTNETCAFWSPAARVWIGESSPVAEGNGSLRCAFAHLTDFGIQSMAPLGDSLNLETFLAENPLGLAVALSLLLIMLILFLYSLRHYTHDRADFAVTEITGSMYARRRYDLHNAVIKLWPYKVLVFLRTHWICGSLCRPLPGDPYERSQRMLTLCCTMMVSLSLNLLFFQSTEGMLELCEGPATDGSPTACTSHSQCNCRTFVQGQCQNSSAEACSCESLASCEYVEFVPMRALAALVVALISMPLTWVMNYLFQTWLHKPEMDLIKQAQLTAADSVTASDVQPGNDHDEADDLQEADTIVLAAEPAVAPSTQTAREASLTVHRRPLRKALRVYAVALVVGIVCLIMILSVTRLFSVARTGEWLKATAASTCVKWLVTDPIQTVLFTKLWVWLHKSENVNTEASGAKVSHAQAALVSAARLVLLGAPVQLPQKASVAKHHAVVHAVAAVDALQQSVLNSATKEAKRRVLRTRSSMSKARLQSKTQHIDRVLSSVLDGQHDMAKTLHSAGNGEATLTSATSMMAQYDSEMAHLQRTLNRSSDAQSDALKARLAHKRRQMAERVVSIERLLHCAEAAGSGEDESPDGGSPAVEEESEEQRAVKAQIVELERAEARIAENDSVLGSRLTARQRGSLSRIRRELKEQRATLARLQTTRSPQGSTAEENARKWKESVRMLTAANAWAAGSGSGSKTTER